MNENYPYHTRLLQARCSHNYTNVGVRCTVHTVCKMYLGTRNSKTSYYIQNTTYITVLKSNMRRTPFTREVLEKDFKSKEELDAFVQEAGKEVSMKCFHMRDRYMI